MKNERVNGFHLFLDENLIINLLLLLLLNDHLNNVNRSWFTSVNVFIKYLNSINLFDKYL